MLAHCPSNQLTMLEADGDNPAHYIPDMFQDFAQDGRLTLDGFRRGLGLLGLEPHLPRRFFRALDEDQDGSLCQQEWRQFSRVLSRGEQQEKAVLVFKMLAPDGLLRPNDLQQVFSQVCLLWSTLSGEKAVPDKATLGRVFSLLDQDGDGAVSFQDFMAVSPALPEIFDWSRLFNFRQLRHQAVCRDLASFSLSKYSQTASFIETLCKSKEELLRTRLKALLVRLRAQAEDVEELCRLSFQRQEDSTSLQLMVSFLRDQEEFGLSRFKSVKREITDERRGAKQRIVLKDLKQNLVQLESLKQICVQISKDRLRELTKTPLAGKTLFKKSSYQFAPGQALLGHREWDNMLTLALGLRRSLLNPQPGTGVGEEDFRKVGQYELISKRDKGFDDVKTRKFYEYAPRAFARLRQKFAVGQEDYLSSLGPQNMIGQFFLGSLAPLFADSPSEYLSPDRELAVRLLTPAQADTLLSVLRSYYDYVLANPRTFLPRLLGLYRLKTYSKSKSQSLFLAVLANPASPRFFIQSRYQLVGQPHRRGSQKLLQDSDWLERQQRLRLSQGSRDSFVSQLRQDLKFLQQRDIVGYRLLLGCSPSYSKWALQSQDGLHWHCSLGSIFTDHRSGQTLGSFLSGIFSASESNLPPDKYAQRLIGFVESHVISAAPQQ